MSGLRRLAALLAVFAVVFAPGAAAGTGSDTGDRAVMELSAAVLAPTFSTAQLTPRRVDDRHEDHAERHEPGPAIDTVAQTRRPTDTGEAVRPVRDPARTVPAQEAWSRRGPPRI